MLANIPYDNPEKREWYVEQSSRSGSTRRRRRSSTGSRRTTRRATRRRRLTESTYRICERPRRRGRFAFQFRFHRCAGAGNSASNHGHLTQTAASQSLSPDRVDLHEVRPVRPREVERTFARPSPPSSRSRRRKPRRRTSWRDDLEKLGPTFVKLGQLLSTRVELLPQAYLDALARLQDKVEPFGFAEVEKIVSSELGRAHFESLQQFRRASRWRRRR